MRPLKALVYNSHFDTYKGVVVYVRIMEGVAQEGPEDPLMRGSTEHDVIEIGQFRPAPTPCDELAAGQVGYFMAQIKNLADVHIGDTVTDALNPTDDGAARLQGTQADGLQRPVPDQQQRLRGAARGPGQAAAQRLQLHVTCRKTAKGLGFGFRCGFLGMLHREIIQQRLERDSDLDLVQTAPNVTYEILTRKGEIDRHRQPAEGARRRPDRGVPRAVRPHQLPAARRRTSAT